MSQAGIVRTSGQTDALNRRLAQTEGTGAVNSGIVVGADRSAEVLKGRVIDDAGDPTPGGARQGPQGGARGARPSGTAHGDASHDGPAGQPTQGGGGTEGTEGPRPGPARAARRRRGWRAEAAKAAETNSQLQSERHLRGRVGHAAAGAAMHDALEGTEFEGADDLYHGARGARRLLGRLLHRLSGRDALAEERPLGQLSEKAYRSRPASAADVQRRYQVQRSMKRSVYAAQEVRVAEAQATARVSGAVRAVAPGRHGGSLLALIGSLVGPLVPIVLGLLLLLCVVAAVGGDEESNNLVNGFGDLSGVELEVAQALSDAGLGRAQIAAIMGNIVGESGFNPNCEYHGEGNNYAYEYGYGLYQFTDTSGGGDEYTRFIRWCSAHGKARSDPAAQTQFFIEHLRGSWGTALHNSGYYTKYLTAFAGRNASYDAWLATDDVDFATYCVMACWLRPADWAARQSFYRDRLPAAQAYYAQLSEGGGYGQEYAASNATQRAIVSAANRTPSTGVGYCAAWVSSAYANAGLGYLGGNANDMYYAWCHSTDRSQLKVGMLVAVASSSSGTAAGAKYGHVGIYIGDNKVIHNIGPIVVWDLDTWIATYCKWSPPGWGFPPNVR